MTTRLAAANALHEFVLKDKKAKGLLIKAEGIGEEARVANINLVARLRKGTDFDWLPFCSTDAERLGYAMKGIPLSQVFKDPDSFVAWFQKYVEDYATNSSASLSDLNEIIDDYYREYGRRNVFVGTNTVLSLTTYQVPHFSLAYTDTRFEIMHPESYSGYSWLVSALGRCCSNIEKSILDFCIYGEKPVPYYPSAIYAGTTLPDVDKHRGKRKLVLDKWLDKYVGVNTDAVLFGVDPDTHEVTTQIWNAAKSLVGMREKSTEDQEQDDDDWADSYPARYFVLQALSLEQVEPSEYLNQDILRIVLESVADK